jgi:hypothetical protein
MKITLKEWASAQWSKPPSAQTLRRYARDAWIYPVPEKRGREYFVEREARFIGSDYTKINDHGSAAA